jgi:uncharacterized protein (TIGR03032 family)
MPHSPRVYDGQVYVLLSLLGALVVVDQNRGSFEEVTRLPGFVRGLARHGEYLFVGMSKIRSGRAFPDIPVDRDRLLPGVAVIHLPTGEVAGMIQYETDCEEIYDVQLLPGVRRPGIVGLSGDMHLDVLSTPDKAYWADPPSARP